MKKLLVILVLHVCVASGVFSQNQASFGQYSVKLAMSGHDTAAQSFYFPGGYLEKFRLAVVSRYNIEDHPATLTIMSGDGPYGSVVYQEDVLVKGINSFFPGADTLEFSSNSSLETFWTNAQNLIDGNVWDFDSMATDFEIGSYFQGGQYTVMVSLDTNIVNQFGYRWILVYGNCYTWPCPHPYDINPYLEGVYYQAYGSTTLADDRRDMAFEVVYREDLSTDVGENGTQIFTVQDGSLIAPENGILEIFDSLGRKVDSKSVFSGDATPLPIGQMLLVVFTSTKGERQVARLIAH